MERHERKAKYETRRGWIKEFNAKLRNNRECKEERIQ
jgi:hypothetical protein